MTSPYSRPEISQTGDPNLGQAGVQNPNVNENLYAASYSGAPGRAADISMPGNGSDLASQGLAKLQQGDQYGGIMTLLDAAQQNPQSVQSTAFLQQLQIVESQPPGAQSAPTDAGQFSAPTDSPAYGTTSDANALSSPASAGGQTDANSIAMQALQAAQQNPTEGILGLMQASAQNPNLLNDQNFLTKMSEVLPQGPGATQSQPVTDGSQLQPTNGSQLQQPTDGSQIQQLQTQQPTDGSQIQQPQTQQPTDGSQIQQPQTQQPTDGSQIQQPQTQQPTDGSQIRQTQVQQPVTTDAPQYSQQQQPPDASQYVQQPTAAPAYTMPAQLTSTGDPNIEAGVKQAFQLIQSGDQLDGAKILMMIAKADPAILQDQAFIKNLTDLENAVKNGTANTPTDQSTASQTGAVDANGNPIPQPGAQQMLDANGNPIPQPGAQQMLDANGNPIPQPGAQQMLDANGNPIPQPGAQSMTGLSTQTAPTDTSTQQGASNSDPTVGAPAS